MDAIIDDDAVGKRYLRLFYEVNEGRIKSITRVDERGVILYNAPSIRTAGTDISDQKHVRARVIQMMNMLTKEMRFSPNSGRAAMRGSFGKGNGSCCLPWVDENFYLLT